MGNSEMFGHVQMAEFQIGTPCMCCGETVILNELEAQGVCIKLCDNCKEAIMFAKEIKEMCTQKMVDNIRDSERLIGVKIGHCPVCGTILFNRVNDRTRFCNACGQAVKWE